MAKASQNVYARTSAKIVNVAVQRRIFSVIHDVTTLHHVVTNKASFSLCKKIIFMTMTLLDRLALQL